MINRQCRSSSAMFQSRNVEKPNIACIFYLCFIPCETFSFQWMVFCIYTTSTPTHTHTHTHGVGDIRISSCVGCCTITKLCGDICMCDCERWEWKSVTLSFSAFCPSSKRMSKDESLFRSMFPATTQTHLPEEDPVPFFVASSCGSFIFLLDWLCWSCISHTE